VEVRVYPYKLANDNDLDIKFSVEGRENLHNSLLADPSNYPAIVLQSIWEIVLHCYRDGYIRAFLEKV